MKGASIGGGNIEIINVDQFDVKFTANYPTLVISHHDRPGMIADITTLLGSNVINIGFMDLDRKGRNREAMTVIETDAAIPDRLVEELLQLSMITEIKKVDLAERGERMRFRTLKQLAEVCASEGLTIAEVMLADQSHESGKPPEYVFEKMRAYYQIMKEAVPKA